MLINMFYKIAKEPSLHPKAQISLISKLKECIKDYKNQREIDVFLMLDILKVEFSLITSNNKPLQTIFQELIKVAFKQFLRKNNIEELFIQERSRQLGRVETIDEFFINYHRAIICNPLLKAFLWCYTSNGREYWADINNKWHEYVENEIK